MRLTLEGAVNDHDSRISELQKWLVAALEQGVQVGVAKAFNGS